MKIVKKENASIYKNSDTSSLLEYSITLGEKDLDFCTNEECNEICYIFEGEGSINLKNITQNFKQ